MRSEQMAKPSRGTRPDRRRLLIECAVEAIAELGYAQASLAEIAARAGVSKGVVSYHFVGKDELIQQVIAHVYELGAAVTTPRIQAETTAAGRLRATIQARVDFYRDYRPHMLALLQIWQNYRSSDGQPRLDEQAHEPELIALEETLRWGQHTGEFRGFAPRVMAVTLRQAFDGVLVQLAEDPGLDTDTYAAELVEIFHRATRAEDPGH